MTKVNVYEAKSSFSKLLARVDAGETIIIARNGVPVAELGPLSQQHRAVTFGDLAGEVTIHEDFDTWGDDDERMWFGE